MKLSADTDLLDYLPGSVRDLVDVVGLPAALAIVEVRGRIRLPVPKVAHSDHWLAACIGLDKLVCLVDLYAGEEIEIPRCESALRRLRELEIHKGAAAGMSNAQLARKYGYTERGIRKLLRRVERLYVVEERQGELF